MENYWDFLAVESSAGPFTLKSTTESPYFVVQVPIPSFAVSIITMMKAFTNRDIHPLAALLLTRTQMLGYGLAASSKISHMIRPTCVAFKLVPSFLFRAVTYVKPGQKEPNRHKSFNHSSCLHASPTMLSLTTFSHLNCPNHSMLDNGRTL
nr:oligopeptide transporter 1-like [Ipomoea batatas]